MACSLICCQNRSGFYLFCLGMLHKGLGTAFCLQLINKRMSPPILLAHPVSSVRNGRTSLSWSSGFLWQCLSWCSPSSSRPHALGGGSEWQRGLRSWEKPDRWFFRLFPLALQPRSLIGVRGRGFTLERFQGGLSSHLCSLAREISL